MNQNDRRKKRIVNERKEAKKGNTRNETEKRMLAAVALLHRLETLTTTQQRKAKKAEIAVKVKQAKAKKAKKAIAIEIAIEGIKLQDKIAIIAQRPKAIPLGRLSHEEEV